MKVEDCVVKNVDWIANKARHYYPENNSEADDLASETIYKCLSQSKRFNSERDFKPWALTIMHNTYITQYNRRMCVQIRMLKDTDVVPSYEQADQRVTVRNALSIIRKCSYKSASIECVLLYAQGYDYFEIAERLNIPYGTVKSRVANGRKILREALV